MANPNQVITRVRKSVEAIRDLKPKYRYEGIIDCLIRFQNNTDFSLAIAAYKASLRIAFISAALFYIIVNVLIGPVKLPNLRKEKVAANISEQSESEPDENYQNGDAS